MTTQRPRWRRPHISLGMLMLLVTLCCIGSAFWWRWPFVVERTDFRERMGPDDVWAPMPRYAHQQVEQVCIRRTETFRRGWGSERIRHGSVISFDTRDQPIGEETWNEGILHGPFRRWFTAGHLRVEGNYDRGAKHGTWAI